MRDINFISANILFLFVPRGLLPKNDTKRTSYFNSYLPLHFNSLSPPHCLTISAMKICQDFSPYRTFWSSQIFLANALSILTPHLWFKFSLAIFTIPKLFCLFFKTEPLLQNLTLSIFYSLHDSGINFNIRHVTKRV